MRIHSFLLTTLLLGTSLLPIASQAAPGGDGQRCERGHGAHHAGQGRDFGQADGHMGGPGHMPHLLRRLDLSEAQRDSVFNLMHSQAPAVHAQMKIVRQAKQELRTLGRSDKFDEAKARAASKSLADATATLALLRTQNEQRIWALLTPEQRKQAEKMRDDDFEPVRGKHRPDAPRYGRM